LSRSLRLGLPGIFGYGYDCPDRYVSDFLLGGVLPEQREIVCQEWGDAVAWEYIPRIRENASDYADVLEIFWAIFVEIQLQPEYFYSYFEEDTSVACPYGGSMTFGPSEAGEALTFDECTYTRGFTLTGSGTYDYDAGEFSITAEVSGDESGSLTFTQVDGGPISVSGEYGGETIDLSR
jgi:hypothetical protein